MRKPFRFKQFDIFQDQTAMKVGTDGVLLGAWAKKENPKHILDIGAGTGLISLMLAQRFPAAFIDAVELDESAYHQTQENFYNSKFNSRLSVTQTAIQEYEPHQLYDLIVSNPPFFITNERVESDARKAARQQETLTFEDLLFKTQLLLAEDGVATFILPFDLQDHFIQIAKTQNLYPKHILHIKGNKEAPFKRSIIELSFKENKCQFSTLIIEVERHRYTDDYIQLTKEFYLKME